MQNSNENTGAMPSVDGGGVGQQGRGGDGIPVLVDKLHRTGVEQPREGFGVNLSNVGCLSVNFEKL